MTTNCCEKCDNVFISGFNTIHRCANAACECHTKKASHTPNPLTAAIDEARNEIAVLFEERDWRLKDGDGTLIANFVVNSLTRAHALGKQEGMEEASPNVGMLRQWLNEDRIDNPKKMVTNEDILYWLETARTTHKGRYHAGKWHDTDCRFPDVDEAVCNCAAHRGDSGKEV